MSPLYALAADHGPLFAHFGAEHVAERSIYAWSPVFRCEIAGRLAVIKRTRRTPADAAAVVAATRQWLANGIRVVTPLELNVPNPVHFGDVHWVAYPFIEGAVYTGEVPQIEAAATLLGRMHALDGRLAGLAGPASRAGSARLPAFRWPDYDQERLDEDVELLRKVMAPHAPAPVVERLVRLVPRFVTDVLPPIRDAQLPFANVSMDYKATNLIYTASGPVLVDPDNGDFAPRLLDLAQAALLFHTDHEPAPERPFDRSEWSTFIRAYLREVELTDSERELWPAAIEYMLAEEGHWAFTGAPEDWQRPRQLSFLNALANVQPDDYPLP